MKLLIVSNMRTPKPFLALCCGGAAMLAGCAAVNQPAVAGSQRFIPTGATIEPSGYATVLRAPADLPDTPPPSQTGPQSEAEALAREQGIGLAEAERLIAERRAHEVEAMRVRTLVAANEEGNFVDWRIDHWPEVRWTFFFKRDPEATLRKYTRNPHMWAAQARYTLEELERIVQPWTELFTKRRLISGWGSDPVAGRVTFMVDLPEAEYRAIAEREGWTLPPVIDLEFARTLTSRAVDPRARPFVRLFPQSDRDPSIILTSATYGRIILDDGCFRVGSRPGAPLAYFARAASLVVDEQGYLAVRSRLHPEESGRIGEWFVWGGYGDVTEDMAMVSELRRQCGGGPIVHVGMPESAVRFEARGDRVDEMARNRRVSRERAWELLTACLRREERRSEDRPPTGDCR